MSDSHFELPDDPDEFGMMLSTCVDRALEVAILRKLAPLVTRIRMLSGAKHGFRGKDLDDFAREATTKCWEKRTYFDRRHGRYVTWWWTVCNNDAKTEIRKRRDTVSLGSEMSLPPDPRSERLQQFLEAALDLRFEFSEADVGRISAWPLQTRIVLLCLSGLWEKVSAVTWGRWADEYGMSAGFPPVSFHGIEDRRERVPALAQLMGISKNLVSQIWCRHKQRLLELDFIRDLDR